jgi:hypothetical protein
MKPDFTFCEIAELHAEYTSKIRINSNQNLCIAVKKDKVDVRFLEDTLRSYDIIGALPKINIVIKNKFSLTKCMKSSNRRFIRHSNEIVPSRHLIQSRDSKCPNDLASLVSSSKYNGLELPDPAAKHGDYFIATLPESNGEIYGMQKRIPVTSSNSNEEGTCSLNMPVVAK